MSRDKLQLDNLPLPHRNAIKWAIDVKAADILANRLIDAKVALLPCHYESCLEYCIKNKTPPAVRTAILRATDVTALPSSLTERLLQSEMRPGGLYGDRENRPCNEELINALWPGINVNTVVSVQREDSPHLLHDLLHFDDRRGGVTSILVEKLSTDPRLDLPPDLLATAYMVLSTKEGTSSRCAMVAGLKNFDPNALIDGQPLLAAVAKNRFVTRNDSVAEPLVTSIITHPDFDPTLPDQNGFNLLDRLEAIPHRSPHYPIFIAQLIERVVMEIKSLKPIIKHRLEKSFKEKVPPLELVPQDGRSAHAFMIAVMADVLPRYAPLAAWAQDLGEVGQYEEALTRLPQHFKERYKEELGKCADELAQKRIAINRDAQPQRHSILERFAKGRINRGHSEATR